MKAINLLGRRSLSSFLKVLLNVVFYAVCLIAVLSVAVAIQVSRATTTRNFSLSLPVRFDINPSAYQIQGTNGATVDARLDETAGKVTVKRPPAASVVLTMLALIALEAVVLVVLYRLRGIFRRLVEGRPFL